MMTLIFLGDVVGEPGRLALYRAMPELREEFAADAIIVNGENAAGGRGITPKIAAEFLTRGADVVTLGDHVWDQSDLAPWLNSEPRVLRPFNLQTGTPGHGSYILETAAGRLGVLCLLGRTFMRPGPENPFTKGRDEALRLRRAAGAQALLVELHGETTSEKVAMGRHLDGIASAVIGTHTHVQTADARILPQGTAYLTDAGMCGSRDGIIGRDIESVLLGCTTDMPCKFPVAGWPVRLSGAVIRIETYSGKATDITPINRDYDR